MSNKLGKQPKSFKSMKAQMAVKNVRATNPMSRPYAATSRAATTSTRAQESDTYDWGRTEITAGKGKKDGNCNRTACQAPLKGREQWYMDGNFTGGPRLYYCGRCARDFTDWDRKSGDPIRCKFDDETDMSERLAS